MRPSCSPDSVPARAVKQSICFVCGPSHPSGLRLQFEPVSGGMMEARWVPQPGWEGFPGIIHGGIVCTVLDEAMSKAVAAAVGDALTAEIKVRLRRPVRPGQELTIRGWIVERHRRRTRTEAVVAGIDGEEFAHAWATFLAPPAGPRKTEIEGDAR